MGRSENPPPLCPPLSRPLLLPLAPRQREREERNLYISTHIHEQPAAQRDEQPGPQEA